MISPGQLLDVRATSPEGFRVAAAFGDTVFTHKTASQGSQPVFFKIEGDDSEIAAIALNKNSSRIIVSTQSKTLYAFDTESGSLLGSRPLNKKAAAVRCADWGGADAPEVVLAADKTGDVVALPLSALEQGGKKNKEQQQQEKEKAEKKIWPPMLLGHTASILTDMAVSACGRWLITADRDEKVRVSAFPTTARVQSYCLGHTAYVACVACAPPPPPPPPGAGPAPGESEAAGHHPITTVASGCGDGWVRAFDGRDGRPLGSFALPPTGDLGIQEEQSENNKDEEGEMKKDAEVSSSRFVPTSVAVSPDQRLIAVVFQGRRDVVLLRTPAGGGNGGGGGGGGGREGGGGEEGEGRGQGPPALAAAGALPCGGPALAVRFAAGGHLVAAVAAPTPGLRAWNRAQLRAALLASHDDKDRAALAAGLGWDDASAAADSAPTRPLPAVESMVEAFNAAVSAARDADGGLEVKVSMNIDKIESELRKDRSRVVQDQWNVKKPKKQKDATNEKEEDHQKDECKSSSS